MRRSRGILLVAMSMGYAAISGCTTLLGVDGDYSLMPGDAGSDSSADGNSGGTAGAGGMGGDGGVGGEGGTGGTAGSGGSGGIGGGGGQAGQGADGGTAGQAGQAGAAGAGGSVVSPLVSMRSGQVSLPAEVAVATVPVAGVDLARSFLVFGYRYDFGNPPYTQVSGQISSAASLTFERNTGPSGVEIPISYYVASFGSGVAVQRGSVAMPGNSVTVPLAIPIDLGKAFPIVSVRTGGNYYGPWNFVRATLTATDMLTLEATGANAETVVEWQVVSFDGASVQTGQASLATGDTSKQAAMASVDPGATWLMFTYTLGNISGGGMSDRLVRARMVSGTELEFSRDGTGAVAEVRWYAVTFDNGSRVVSGESTMEGTTQTVTAPLASPVDSQRSLATTAGFYGRGGSTNYSNNNAGITMFTLDLGGGDSMLARRTCTAGGSVVADVTWSAVEFR